MKCLALDYGKTRVGLALGDTATKVAVGKGVIEGLSQNKLIAKIKAIVSLEHSDWSAAQFTRRSHLDDH